MGQVRLLVALGIAALALLAGAAPARAQADLRLRIDTIDQSSYPRVVLQVSLLDGAGRTLPDIDGTRFMLREGGAAREALLSPDSRPLDLVIVIDLSCAETLSLDQIRAAVGKFLDQQRAGDRVAVMLVGEVPWVASSFTSDRAVVENIVGAISADRLGPDLALYNGVYEALRMAGQGPAGRSAVVLITNGVNRPTGQTSSLSFGDLATFAAAQRVPLTTLVVGDNPRRADLLAISSGAALVDSVDPGGVERAASYLAASLRRGYRVSFALGAPAGEQEPARDLEVYVPGYGTALAPIPLAQLPTPTATGTPTPSVTVTPTPSATVTPTPSATVTPTPSATGALTPSATGAAAPRVTNTPAPTEPAMPSPTPTAGGGAWLGVAGLSGLALLAFCLIPLLVLVIVSAGIPLILLARREE